MTAPVRPPAWTTPDPLPARRVTPRLELRFYVPEDAAALVAAIDEDRDSYLPWLPWVRVDNRTVAEAVFNIERFRRVREEAAPSDFVFAYFDRANGSLVGGTGFHRISHATHEAEIGYWTRPSRRGEGLCTEAIEHLITWGFEDQDRGGWGFRRLHIAAASLNAASCRVPEKLGLPREAERRGDRWVDGVGWADSLGWGTTADRWAVSRAGRGA